MRLSLRRTAVKDLAKFDAVTKNAILIKIQELEKFPNLSNIKKLTNFKPSYRLRVGDYRVLFDVLEDELIIARVMHRKEVYKR